MSCWLVDSNQAGQSARSGNPKHIQVLVLQNNPALEAYGRFIGLMKQQGDVVTVHNISLFNRCFVSFLRKHPVSCL